MAGIDDKREQEHKQRVKKLKAKTSKMRIAIIDGYGRKPKYPYKNNQYKEYYTQCFTTFIFESTHHLVYSCSMIVTTLLFV